MTTVGPVAMRAPVLHDEVTAALGARRLATAVVAGLALGALSLLVTLSQAVNDHAAPRPLLVGVLGYVPGLTAGWVAGGVPGMAIGGVCGTVVALGVLLIREAGRHGSAEHADAPSAAVLRSLRRGGALAPGGNGQGRTVADGTGPDETDPGWDTGQNPERALRLLVDAVWRGDVRPASDEELRAALAVARTNRVEGRLARAYPRQLATTLDAVSEATHRFRRNLVESTDRLGAADIPTVLIKTDPSEDLAHGDIDLVVPTDRWKAAQEALRGWYVERSTHWLERSTSVLLEPPDGPSAQLHTSVAWHGVAVMATDRLFAHAVPDHDGRAWLVPCPADRLRIRLAHGLFRNQSLDLSELLALRELLAPDVVAEARAQIAREGWSAGGDRALDLATEAMAALGRGELVRLPLPLPVTTSLRTGVEHAGHLLTHGRASAAAREVALRVPLAVHERLRRRTP
ncbi:hypothetical protein [Streptomyces sp. NPDC056527]|uniref:hypothetical protein n=1 Tax=Streptomyces sp. NPDC056527 TaxID=3345853 RepID=UPI0036BC4F8C